MSAETSNAFWTYWFLALGVILLLFVIVQFSDEIEEICSELYDCIKSALFPDRERKHRRKSRRWKIVFPILRMRIRKWEQRVDTFQSKFQAVDAVAETLATHQEILEEMYGNVPSASQLYRKVRKRYH